MNLAVSNIAWAPSHDVEVYGLLRRLGFSGLEIAPTRIFPENPYSHFEEAVRWSSDLRKDYGLSIPSMQSIWFGRDEKLFGTKEERDILLAYTRQAIDFAKTIQCRNLVFGCPKNRDLPANADPSIAIDFFREIGNYALGKGTIIGMEANPPVYQTNYINDTFAALALVQEVNSGGFRLNLDVGTMIQNAENVRDLAGYVSRINHVHISEPLLKPIVRRDLHRELFSLLASENYTGYVSVEMGKTEDIDELQRIMQYVYEVFGK